MKPKQARTCTQTHYEIFRSTLKNQQPVIVTVLSQFPVILENICKTKNVKGPGKTGKETDLVDF